MCSPRWPCRSSGCHPHTAGSWWSSAAHCRPCDGWPPCPGSARQGKGLATLAWTNKLFALEKLPRLEIWLIEQQETKIRGSKIQGTLTNLCFGWQGLDLLDEEGVRLHHDHQWDTCGLLDTAHQARVVHHLRPLTQGWRSLTATIGTARDEVIFI